MSVWQCLFLCNIMEVVHHMEDGTDFCWFAFCEFISSPRENLQSETFVTCGKHGQNSACLSVFQFGKIALWNNLVMRLWRYNNYFRIKYRPCQPSSQSQLSLDQYGLWFWQIFFTSFLVKLVPSLLCATTVKHIQTHTAFPISSAQI